MKSPMANSNSLRLNNAGLNPLSIAVELQAGVVDYHDPKLFDQASTMKYKGHIKNRVFPVCNNPTVQNEMWAFISHNIIDRKFSPVTISRQLYELYELAQIVDEHYPAVSSLLDIPLQDVILHIQKYRQSQDINSQQYSNDRNIIDANGQLKRPHFASTFNTLWSFLADARCKTPEREKDIWDVRKLGIPVKIAEYKPIFSIDFTEISQEWFKLIAKDYIYYILPIRSVGTATQTMAAFRHLSAFLRSRYPKMRSFSNFDRAAAEGFLRSLGKNGYSANWYNTCVSCVRTFFLTELIRGKDVPKNDVFLDSDYQKKVAGAPDYFSDFELQQINAHLDDVPQQYARMTIILEECGMRLSDLVCSTIIIDGRPSLVENANGDFLFTYYMPKTKRNNTMPISLLAAATLKAAIDESKKLVGPNAKYIFSKNIDRPISTDNYRIMMKKMATKHHLVTDSGEPLQIKGHTFRGTVATEFVNNGLAPSLVKDLLGQRTLGILKHYVEIHNDTMLTYLKPILEEANRRIANIGQDVQIEPITVTGLEEIQVALPNGRCAKNVETGLCGEITQCLDCQLFQPTVADLPVLENQLKSAKKNILLATSQGFTRIAEANEDLANRLEAIISRLKEGKHGEN